MLNLALPFKSLFHHSEKEAVARRKLQKTRRAYIKERLKEREHLNREISDLDRLLKENSIDEYTYTRYKKLLEMGYERKRQQTRERYGFTQNLTPTGRQARAEQQQVPNPKNGTEMPQLSKNP
jgi:hypothetical protein